MRLVLSTLFVSSLIFCGIAFAGEPPIKADHAAAKAAPAEGHVAEDGWTQFGADFTIAEAIEVKALLDAPEGYVGKAIRVRGEVTDVCQKAGCWLVLTDGSRLMRVTIKDHGFAVAKDGAGSHCEVEGTVLVKDLDPKEVEHFAGESKNADKLPEHEAKAGKVYSLVATGVRFKAAS